MQGSLLIVNFKIVL